MNRNPIRATINLDSEAHHFASIYVDAKGITLSAAISEIIRRAEQDPSRNLHYPHASR